MRHRRQDGLLTGKHEVYTKRSFVNRVGVWQGQEVF